MEEVARCSVASERYWTEEKERALITYYSKHTCLWNHKSEGYKNRQLRCKTLEHLRVILSAHLPPASFTVEDIKSKFKNLRTTFQRQYKMVSACGGGRASPSDEVFVSQWKYFHDLLFLTSYSQQQDRSSDDLLFLTSYSQQQDKSSEAVPRHEEEVKMENESVLLVLPGLPAPSSSSSSSSSSFSSSGGRCYWTEEKERALISFYAEHGCLWNKKSVNHNNRQLRLRTLEILHNQLSEGQPVPFTVEDIKSKFNNLRTVFNREVKAVSRTERDSDRPYVSQWKHYDQLMFLLRESSCCDDDDETENNPPLPLAAQEVEEEEEEDLKPGSRGGAHRLPDANLLSSCSTQMEIKLEEPDSPEPSDCHYLHPDFHQSDTKTHIPAYIPASTGQCQLRAYERQERLGLAAPTVATLLPPTCLSSFAQGNNTGALNRTLASLAFPAMNTRCHWTEAKVCELISFYADHSCLWNHRSESYRNRERRQNTLEELSRRLSQHNPVPFTVEEIKTKFRNLRTIFQREHKTLMTLMSKTNKGSEDFCKPKWRHYRQLLFLCDSEGDEALPDPDPGPYIGHLQEDGLLKLVVRSPSDRTTTSSMTSTHLFHQSDPRLSAVAHHHHQHQEGPSSPTPPASFHSSPSSGSGSSCSPAANHVLSSSLASGDGSRGPGLKRPNSHLMELSAAPCNGTTGLLGTCCHGGATSPHAGFLKYVEECLNETPPDKVKRLKKLIIETIHSTSEEM